MSIYGLLIGIAVVFSLDRIINTEKKLKYVDILLVLISSLVFSRLLFVFHNLQEVVNRTVNPIDITDGGLTLYGALIGLIFSLFVISKYRNIPLLRLTDRFFLYVPLVQAIGRWGNYFNNELYGKPTSLPWGIEIPPQDRLPGYEQYSKFHPIFLYESFLDLLNFLFLRNIVKKQIPQGLITFLFFMIYGVIRLIMNTLRIDKEYFLNIETSDLFSVLSIFIGFEIFIYIYRRKRQS